MVTFNRVKIFLIITFQLNFIDSNLIRHHHLHTCPHLSEFPTQNCISSETFALCTGGDLPVRGSSLQELSICHWPNETFNFNELTNIGSLLNLSISYSNISILEDDVPENLNYLEILVLQRLQIYEINYTLLKKFKFLKVLDLRNNKIANIDSSLMNQLVTVKKFYLNGNIFMCIKTEILKTFELIENEEKIVDREKILCSTNQYSLYPAKPIVVIVKILKNINRYCPEKCFCDMLNAVWDPNTQVLIPVITVDCKNLNFSELPSVIPANTTSLYLQGNKISSLQPLSENPLYFHLADLFLDDNLITSIAELEGIDWLNQFRVLSLAGNHLEQVPIYALDNALQRNRNVVRLYLGRNPWVCDCQFTPSFQDLLLKYKTIINDLQKVKCVYKEGDENSLQSIFSLPMSAVCNEPTNYLVEPLDVLNITLALLIAFVLLKFVYDYYKYKKTGKLPWIVTKIP